jgi:CheY-like chemotaxis protein
MSAPKQSGFCGLSRSRRVLIVDDQQDAAELMAMLLEDHGHEVRVAHDGQAALAQALEFLPQVALLDIGLPGMDGLQLAVAIRATPQLSDCRLIAVSGYCGAEHRARSRAAGFEMHLAKPLGVDALLLAVGSLEDNALTLAAASI